MLKVLKNTLRAPASSNGPRLPRKTERSLACLACNDAHCVCLLSYAYLPTYPIPVTCDDTRRAITSLQVPQ